MFLLVLHAFPFNNARVLGAGIGRGYLVGLLIRLKLSPMNKQAVVPGWGKPILLFLLGTLFTAVNFQTLLGQQISATAFFSNSTWHSTIEFLGGRFESSTNSADVPLGRLLGILMGGFLLCWVGGSWILSRKSDTNFQQAMKLTGATWGWWLIPLGWELIMLAAYLLDFPTLREFLLITPAFLYGVILAGWLAAFWNLVPTAKPLQIPDEEFRDGYQVSKTVWIAASLYLLIFTAMNWGLYWNLRIPHGDSGMYEEHLWNIWHGKGFRSYLDQGLFLGEHLQVIHLLLLPLHFLWPSQLMLELMESLALAAGAIPVYWLTLRHSRSIRVANCLACAYLLYFPLQFLDIAIDLKTFRPISFGIPLLLVAIDQYERRRVKTMWLFLLLTLAAKEDFAIIIALFGGWAMTQQILVRKKDSKQKPEAVRAETPVAGWPLLLVGVVYLILATRVMIPWFREGAEVHYARYFPQFGETLPEIVKNMLLNPGLLLGELFTTKTLLYALSLLLPLGGLPLFSPSRLMVAVPLFFVLCLNVIAQDPRHHFHAPLIPILFWAAAAGTPQVSLALGKIRNWRTRQSTVLTHDPAISQRAAHFVVCAAFSVGIFFTLSPLGFTFWDSGSNWNWRMLYIPDERAEQFSQVPPQIPQDARVASTDFVHTRFTHYERSYDYSQYARKVSGYQLTVPADTDFIVIDTQHPYSQIKSPADIEEYKQHPEQWDLLPDTTNGYFIILKRVPDTHK